MFIQDDIMYAFMDDFMVLPATQIWRNVYEGLPDAVERHDWLFYLTH